MASASGVEQKGPAARAWEWILRALTDGPARYTTRQPEEMLINDLAVLQATTKKVTVNLAYLSLTWSTVVLLGGFVSALKLVDFWFLTAISAAFAVNLADVFEYKKEFMLAAGRLHIVLRNHMVARGSPSRGHGGRCLLVEIMKSMLAEACLGVSAIVFFVGFYILSVVPLVAIFLASVRLAKNSYGDSGGDATNAVKLKASLQIFYSFALAQNVIFCFWSLLLYTRGPLSARVSSQCKFGKWGKRLVKRYLDETAAICAKEGSVPQGRNLVSFAVTLLGSESLGDRHSAVRLLDTFVGTKRIPVGRPDLLLPSRKGLGNLMEVLEVGDGETGDCETRERAAKAVAALAGDLRHIDHFPTALDHIASLLQASDCRFPATACRGGVTTGARARTTSMPEEHEAGRNNKQGMYGAYGPVYWGTLIFLHLFSTSDSMEDDKDVDFQCGGPKELVSQGMLIIERLTLHQGNCVHICSNHGLLSRITAPINSLAFLDVAELDIEWIDILSRSLRILARLIRAPGKACTRLRNEIASRQPHAVENLTKILEGDKFGPVLKAAAIEILAELASDEPTVMGFGKDEINKFISQLRGIFLAKMDDSELMMHKAAGQALARMLAVWDDARIQEMFIAQSTGSAEVTAEEKIVGQLTDIIITNRGSRTMAVEILVRLCSHFTRNDKDKLPRQEVIKMFTKILQLMRQHVPRPANNGAGVRANNTHAAAQNDVENPRPAPEDHTEDRSSSKGNEEQQQEGKEFEVALLSLAVVVCDKIFDKQDFTCAVVPVLVRKLKEMIETNNDTTVECLSAVKLSCQLIVSMVHLDPSCIKVFMDHNFKDVLTKASESLTNLDNCKLFDADYHQVTKTEKPLASLVKQAQEHFDKAQELGNNGPE